MSDGDSEFARARLKPDYDAASQATASHNRVAMGDLIG